MNREYRIYGHKCTKRRYIIDWIGASIYSVATGIAAALFVGTAAHCVGGSAPWYVMVLTGFMSAMAQMYYRLNAMNVNGYSNEENKEPINNQLFPWKGK